MTTDLKLFESLILDFFDGDENKNQGVVLDIKIYDQVVAVLISFDRKLQNKIDMRNVSELEAYTEHFIAFFDEKIGTGNEVRLLDVI
jgi:hypothetical protein